VVARAAGSGLSRAVVRPGKTAKKLLNDPDEVLVDALTGVAAAHPSLRVDLDRRYVVRAGGPTPGKVSLLSGGGSGHEPLHGGFVGYGMLDAACAGEVFTSPVPDRILAATKAVDSAAGVLYIVKNYTGDILNFQMAARLAAGAGVRVETVVVNDDVAVDNRFTAGRRGTGGTVFVEKIVGAAAEQGVDLAALAALAREVNDRSRSFGVALTPCVVPAAGRPGFELADDEIELGVGIHGEPGRVRGALVSVKEIARIALEAIHADAPLSGDVLVMVNGLGGTPLIELYIVFAAVADWLAAHGVTIARSLVGARGEGRGGGGPVRRGARAGGGRRARHDPAALREEAADLLFTTWQELEPRQDSHHRHAGPPARSAGLKPTYRTGTGRPVTT